MQQPMTNPKDITDPTTAMNMKLVLMAKAFKLNYSTPTNNNQRISSNPRNRQIAQPGMNLGQDKQMHMVRVQNLGIQNVGNQNGLIVVPGIANQNLNPNGNGNVVAARAEGKANGNNGNQIRCYNCRGLGHLARNLIVRPKRRDVAYLQTQLLIAQKEEVGIKLQAKDFYLMAAAGDLDEIKEVNANCILMANLQQASTSSTQTDKAPVYDSDGSAEGHEYDNCYNNDILNMFTQEEQYTELLDPIPEPHQVQRNDSDVIFTVSEQKDTIKGTSENTKFANQSILGKPFLKPLRNHSVVRQPNAFQSERPKRVPPKVAESNDLLNSVTSNSVPTPTESKVVTNDKVIALGMFRINPFKTSREDKFVRINKVRASVRTNPITVSQPHVLTKKDVNSNSNGLSSTGVDITTKTRRPQPRSNTKNDRVSSASKNSCIKNKEVEVEEHHRNLLLSKNKKHMSSECNNVKLAIRNDKSEVVCAMCKQCLITANHDVCVLNYMNGMNSRGKKQKANVSNIANQTKLKPKVRKPNQVGFKERLASPKPSQPLLLSRILLDLLEYNASFIINFVHLGNTTQALPEPSVKLLVPHDKT
ncbi:hypothetical protein Tco_1046114 [Tanacetum coccineum]